MSKIVNELDRGHVRIIQMHRPEKKNAASLELA